MEHLELAQHKAQDFSYLLAVDPFGTERDILKPKLDWLLIAQKAHYDSPVILGSYRARALPAGCAVAKQFLDGKLIEFPVIFLLFLLIIVENSGIRSPVLLRRLPLPGTAVVVFGRTCKELFDITVPLLVVLADPPQDHIDSFSEPVIGIKYSVFKHYRKAKRALRLHSGNSRDKQQESFTLQLAHMPQISHRVIEVALFLHNARE